MTLERWQYLIVCMGGPFLWGLYWLTTMAGAMR